MKYVKVEFLEGPNYKQYAYKTVLDLKVGDMVVVEARASYGLAKVVTVGGFESKATRFVVSRVDLSALEDMKVKEEEIARIKREIAKRKQEFEEEKFLEMFAAQDSEAASLLKQLKELEG